MPASLPPIRRPPDGTVDAWAFDYIMSRELDDKLAPSAPPSAWEDAPPARRLISPGRPRCLEVVPRSPKTPTPGALVHVERRRALVHTFFHHELQAAELMLWALLAFPEAPRAFRRGLIAIFREEVSHMRLYAAHIAALGGRIGEFPVRDWFWQRLVACETTTHFVATMGLGLEGANLDHTTRFADAFEAAGDFRGADIQRQVGRDEVRHVRFALRWFRRWTGGASFDDWRTHLPKPLSPVLMKGPAIDERARLRAGFDQGFVDALRRWQPESPGSSISTSSASSRTKDR